MKKLLLATSAIILMAGTALADAHSSGISVSGSGAFGIQYSDGKDLTFHHEFDITFSASGTTDGGVGFGASVMIDNTEGISATTTTSVTDGSIDVTQGTATAQKISQYISVTTRADDNDTTVNACYLYRGEIYSLAQMKAVTGVNDTTNAFLGTGVTGIGADNDTVSFTTNAEVKDAIDKNSENSTDNKMNVEVKLVDDVVTEIGVGNETAKKTFWNGEGKKLVIHKVVGTNGQELVNGCANGTEVDAVFDSGNYYNYSSMVAGTSAAQAGSTATSTTTGTIGNHASVYISLDNHKLSIGSDLTAADKLSGAIAEIGFDGLGVDNQAESIYGTVGKDVRYDGTFGLATVALSYGDPEWAAGFSFDVAPISIGAGFNSKGVASVGLGITQGQISGNILYTTDSDTDDDATNMRQKSEGMGLDVTYQMSDATSVTLVFGRHQAQNVDPTMSVSKDAFGVGFSHNLGGGATLAAGVASVDSKTEADLGIKMSF